MKKHVALLCIVGILLPVYVTESIMLQGKTRGIRPLHDPFILNNGTRVRSTAEWQIRRGEIMDLLEDVEYGHLAPAPDLLPIVNSSTTNLTDPDCTDWSLVVRVVPNASQPGTNFTFTMHVYIPLGQGPGPFPCMVRVGYGYMPIPISRGYAFCYYDNLDFDPDEDVIGPAERAYPDQDWGSLSIWTWGFMRTLDVLLAHFPEIDPNVIISSGHSRTGKVALLAGAFDERVTVAAPTHSGTGGAGSFLVQSPGSETLASITSPDVFDYWFTRSFAGYAGRERDLPFDQHFLKALVAPRYIACVEARDYEWGNPEGNWATHLAAREVYRFLNASDNIGINWRDGGHVYHDELENNAICDFVDSRLLGNDSISRDFESPAYPDYGAARDYFHWIPPID